MGMERNVLCVMVELQQVVAGVFSDDALLALDVEPLPASAADGEEALRAFLQQEGIAAPNQVICCAPDEVAGEWRQVLRRLCRVVPLMVQPDPDLSLSGLYDAWKAKSKYCKYNDTHRAPCLLR